MIECIITEYSTQSMGELEYSVGCTINHDITNITLKLSQPDPITNMTQEFNKYLKSLMTFNTPAKSHEGTVRNQETDTKISYDP